MDNYLGTQPQHNTPFLSSWPEFYRERRLLPQMQRAEAAGLLPPQRRIALERVIAKLDTLLEGLPPESSLIHGDLWSGNFLCTKGDTPVLIDPAVYHAPREMELAYVQLFDGFPPDFVRHYSRAFPLDPGYERRKLLHQLYPLLIHLNHFGETYGRVVDGVCREYLA
jgi:fructosamine-3-kinase